MFYVYNTTHSSVYLSIYLCLQLCDPVGIQNLELIVNQLKLQLGNLPNHVERQDSRLHFIEVPLVDTLGALSHRLATPRAHVLVIHVEGVVQGPKLDTCLVLFIRRVFEEMDRAAQSKEVVSSACQTKSGPSCSWFPLLFLVCFCCMLWCVLLLYVVLYCTVSSYAWYAVLWIAMSCCALHYCADCCVSPLASPLLSVCLFVFLRVWNRVHICSKRHDAAERISVEHNEIGSSEWREHLT